MTFTEVPPLKLGPPSQVRLIDYQRLMNHRSAMPRFNIHTVTYESLLGPAQSVI